MKIIDIDSWDRKDHFLLFKQSACAQYHIGLDLDITSFKMKIKNQGLSFTMAMTYACSLAMNQVEQFRYRISKGRIILHEVIHPALAYVAPDRKYFKMVVVELDSRLEIFAAKALAQKDYFISEDLRERDDLIFISSLPKVSFTHLSHTLPANKDDAVPRLSWGKYYLRDGALMLPFNVQAHHGFVDGDHMGCFLEDLQGYLHNY